MREDLPSVSQIQWLPVYNDSGETIPAFAAMRITGLKTSTLEYTVAKPNTNDAVANILFNGPVEIPTAMYGMGTADLPGAVRYDTADGTPSNGDEWGVANADWKLRNARSGFLIQGVIDSSNGIAVAVRKVTNGVTSPVETTDVSFSGARVYNSAHHSNLGSASIEDVTFDSEDFDTDTYHDTGSNTARLTVPSTGYYQVGCNLAISPITPDINQLMSVALAHNGSTNIGHWEANDWYAATGTMLYHCCITTIWYASASDYFTVRVDGQGVGGVKVWFLSKSEPVFWIQRLGA